MNPDLGMKFHHFGLAVKREDLALIYLQALGYEPGPLIYDPEQNVNLRMAFHLTEPAIEIIMPGQGDGPLTPIFKRFEELIYHMCYEVESLDQTLVALANSSVMLIPVSPPKPAILFGGRKVSFYRVKGFGTIELLEQ